MDDAIKFLLAAAAAAATGIAGYFVGKSSAQARIEELQKEMLRLQEINRQREEEMAKLRVYIEQVQQDIAVIKSQRNIFAKFGRWLVGEHPEVLQRYQYVQQAEASIATIQQQASADHQTLVQKYEQARQEYPTEMAAFEAKIAAQPGP